MTSSAGVGQIAGSTCDFDRAFLRFYDETKSSVYGFVLARSGDPGVAEEVLAETYADAIAHLRARRDDPITTGWLTTVAMRRLVDHWRRTSSTNRKIARLRGERERLLELDERDTTVLAALQSLPTRQRAAVTLRYVDELSVSEVGEHLGVGYKAAESLLTRGRTSLRVAYQELSRDD